MGSYVELDNLNSNSPRFPGDGILILGQEQETLCGGFDDYDSLSGDLSDFNVRIRLPKLKLYDEIPFSP